MTENTPTIERAPGAKHRHLGLPFIAVVGLALLALPRIILHDLHVIHEGTWANALLVFVPPLVWIAVALWRRVPNAFVTVLVIGCFSGLVLVLGHQILWEQGFGGDSPSLGGNLADLDPAVQSVIIRSFAAVSSMVTGAVVGAVAGLVAWVIQVVARKSQ